MDDEQTATLDEVAQKIAKGKPHAWLVEPFRWCCRGLRAARRSDERQKSPKALRRQLENVRDAAGTLLKSLDDPLVFAILYRHGDNDDEWAAALDFIAELKDVEARADRSILSVRKGQGQGPAWPSAPNLLSARAFCALCVSEAWSSVQGLPPGSSNADAHQAAEMLWLASGGASLGRGDNLDRDTSLERWRRSFDDAGSAPHLQRNMVHSWFKNARPP